MLYVFGRAMEEKLFMDYNNYENNHDLHNQVFYKNLTHDISSPDDQRLYLVENMWPEIKKTKRFYFLFGVEILYIITLLITFILYISVIAVTLGENILHLFMGKITSTPVRALQLAHLKISGISLVVYLPFLISTIGLNIALTILRKKCHQHLYNKYLDKFLEYMKHTDTAQATSAKYELISHMFLDIIKSHVKIIRGAAALVFILVLWPLVLYIAGIMHVVASDAGVRFGCINNFDVINYIKTSFHNHGGYEDFLIDFNEKLQNLGIDYQQEFDKLLYQLEITPNHQDYQGLIQSFHKLSLYDYVKFLHACKKRVQNKGAETQVSKYSSENLNTFVKLWDACYNNSPIAKKPIPNPVITTHKTIGEIMNDFLAKSYLLIVPDYDSLFTIIDTPLITIQASIDDFLNTFVDKDLKGYLQNLYNQNLQEITLIQGDLTKALAELDSLNINPPVNLSEESQTLKTKIIDLQAACNTFTNQNTLYTQLTQEHPDDQRTSTIFDPLPSGTQKKREILEKIEEYNRQYNIYNHYYPRVKEALKGTPGLTFPPQKTDLTNTGFMEESLKKYYNEQEALLLKNVLLQDLQKNLNDQYKDSLPLHAYYQSFFQPDGVSYNIHRRFAGSVSKIIYIAVFIVLISVVVLLLCFLKATNPEKLTQIVNNKIVNKTLLDKETLGIWKLIPLQFIGAVYFLVILCLGIVVVGAPEYKYKFTHTINTVIKQIINKALDFMSKQPGFEGIYMVIEEYFKLMGYMRTKITAEQMNTLVKISNSPNVGYMEEAIKIYLPYLIEYYLEVKDNPNHIWYNQKLIDRLKTKPSTPKLNTEIKEPGTLYTEVEIFRKRIVTIHNENNTTNIEEVTNICENFYGQIYDCSIPKTNSTGFSFNIEEIVKNTLSTPIDPITLSSFGFYNLLISLQPGYKLADVSNKLTPNTYVQPDDYARNMAIQGNVKFGVLSLIISFKHSVFYDRYHELVELLDRALYDLSRGNNSPEAQKLCKLVSTATAFEDITYSKELVTNSKLQHEDLLTLWIKYSRQNNPQKNNQPLDVQHMSINDKISHLLRLKDLLPQAFNYYMNVGTPTIPILGPIFVENFVFGFDAKTILILMVLLMIPACWFLIKQVPIVPKIYKLCSAYGRNIAYTKYLNNILTTKSMGKVINKYTGIDGLCVNSNSGISMNSTKFQAQRTSITTLNTKINNYPVETLKTIHFVLYGIVAMIGQSGAGKSTFLLYLLGLIKQTIDMGDMILVRLNHNGHKTIVPYHTLSNVRDKIKFIAQSLPFNQDINIQELMDILAPNTPMVLIKEICKLLNLEIFIMDKTGKIYENKLLISLSGGTRRRLMIALSLCAGIYHGNEDEMREAMNCFIVDEFTGLDPESVHKAKDLLIQGISQRIIKYGYHNLLNHTHSNNHQYNKFIRKIWHNITDENSRISGLIISHESPKALSKTFNIITQLLVRTRELVYLCYDQNIKVTQNEFENHYQEQFNKFLHNLFTNNNTFKKPKKPEIFDGKNGARG